LQAGMVYEFFKLNYNGSSFNQDIDQYIHYLLNKGSMDQFRIFGDWQHKFSDKLTFNGGVHAHILFLNESKALEPRAALRWQAFHNGSFSLGAGLHSQTQPRSIYFLKQLADTINNIYINTNSDLDFSRSLHLVAGYDHLLASDIRLKLEMYYQHLYNLPVAKQRPEYSTIITGGNFSYWVYHHLVNKGTGRNYGMELTLEKFLNKGFYYLFTASVFDATYRGWDGVRRNSAFNNNYIVNALGGYELHINRRHLFSVDLKGVLAGGTRYIPINVQLSKIKGEAEYEWNKAFDNRYPDYFRLNARIRYGLNGRNINQEWALELQNITNHRNIFMQTWNRYRNELSTSYQMEFMPVITYKVFF
jgi:hypothetical protein